MSGQLAAREGDCVGGHVGAGSGSRFLASALKYAAIGAVAAAVVVGAALAAPAIAAAAGAGAVVTAVAGATAGAVGGGVGATLAIVGTAMSGAAAGIGLQRDKEGAGGGGGGGGGCSSINTGSHNVSVETKKVARAQRDTNTHGPPPKLNEGSSYVMVNSKPLTRKDDKSCCGGKVITSASKTWIGGPPTNGGAGAAPITGPAFSITDADTWNWNGIETGLNVGGFLLGFGVVKGAWKVGFAAWKAGGMGAVKTAMKPMAKEVGTAVAGSMAMSTAGKQIGTAVGGSEGGVNGSLVGEALANATPWGKAASLAKSAASKAAAKLRPSPVVEAPHTAAEPTYPNADARRNDYAWSNEKAAAKMDELAARQTDPAQAAKLREAAEAARTRAEVQREQVAKGASEDSLPDMNVVRERMQQKQRQAKNEASANHGDAPKGKMAAADGAGGAAPAKAAAPPSCPSCGGARGGKAKARAPAGLGRSDLSANELARIQRVVNATGRPLIVHGPAARGKRGPSSNVDYVIPDKDAATWNASKDVWDLPGLSAMRTSTHLNEPSVRQDFDDNPSILFRPNEAPVVTTGRKTVDEPPPVNDRRFALDAPGFGGKSPAAEKFGRETEAAFQNSFKEPKRTLDEQMDYFAKERARIARETNDPDAEQFGTRRGENDHAITPVGKSDRYRAVGDDIRAQGRMETVRVDVDGKPVELTTTTPMHMDYGTPAIMHTPPENVPIAMQQASRIHEELLNSNLTTEQAMQKAGELHWWLAHAMPYQRGSAAISDMAVKQALARKGIDPQPARPGVVPDLVALRTSTPDEFARQYGSLFEKPPSPVGGVSHLPAEDGVPKGWLADLEARSAAAQARGAGAGPSLSRLHPDATTMKASSYEHWQRQPTEDIVRSLRPGAEEPLMVDANGKVWQGNTRVKVLQERGYDVDSLPRERYQRSEFEDPAERHARAIAARGEAGAGGAGQNATAGAHGMGPSRGGPGSGCTSCGAAATRPSAATISDAAASLNKLPATPDAPPVLTKPIKPDEAEAKILAKYGDKIPDKGGRAERVKLLDDEAYAAQARASESDPERAARTAKTAGFHDRATDQMYIRESAAARAPHVVYHEMLHGYTSPEFRAYARDPRTGAYEGFNEGVTEWLARRDTGVQLGRPQPYDGVASRVDELAQKVGPKVIEDAYFSGNVYPLNDAIQAHYGDPDKYMFSFGTTLEQSTAAAREWAANNLLGTGVQPAPPAPPR